MTKRRKYQMGGFGPFQYNGPLNFGPFQITGNPLDGNPMNTRGNPLDPNGVSQLPILQQLLNNQDIASQIRGLADLQTGANYNDRVDLSNTIQRGVYGFKKGGEVHLTPGMLQTVSAMRKQQGGMPENIPVSPRGLHSTNGPVVVPSRNLTFQGINTPTAVIPLPGQDAVMEIPMPGLTKEMDLRNKIAQLSPDSIPSILDTMRHGGRPLTRDYVDHMFLGGLWDGIKSVGKGIGKGLAGVADFGLSSLGLGDIIDNTFVDNSGFLSGLTGAIGSAAVPILGTVNPLLGAGLGAAQGLGIGRPGGGIKDALFGAASSIATTGFGGGAGFGNIGDIAKSFAPDVAASFADNLVTPSAPQMPQGIPQGGGLGFPFPGMGYGGINPMAMFGMQGINPQANMQMGMQQQNPLAGLGQLLPFLTQGMGLLSSLGNMQQGGPVIDMNKARFKEGGFVGIPSNGVPIQTEVVKKGGKTIPELIIWPDYSITEVNATDTHGRMMKDGDGDMVTDIVTEESFITSAYGGIKIKRSDAEKIETGLKLHPYSEHEKGKMPEVTTLADVIFTPRDKRKEITPAEATENVRKTHRTFRGYENTDGSYETNIFDDLTNEVNRANRAKYLDGIMQLSEFEKAKKELKKVERENRKELKGLASGVNGLFKARHGGRVYKSGVRKFQVQGVIPPDVQAEIDRIVNPSPTGPLHGTTPINPATPPVVPATGGNPFASAFDNLNLAQQHNTSSAFGPAAGGQGQAPGSSFLQTAGTFLSGAGTAASAVDNFVTAGQLSGLLGNQMSALDAFRNNQQNLFTGARLANIAPSLLGPEAAQREQLSRRRFISPTRASALQSAGLDNQTGQVLSALRNNPNISSGEAISSIINAQAPSRVQIAQDRLNREQQILSSNDQIADANKDIRFQNQQLRNDLTNSRLQNTFGNISGLFTDIAGNEQGRIRDHQNLELAQLLQPQRLRQAGLQGITNLGGVFLGADALKNRSYMYDTMAQTSNLGNAINSIASNPIVLSAIQNAFQFDV